MALNIEKEEKKIYHNRTVRLSEDILKQLESIASDKNISFNKLVQKLVEYGLKDIQ